MSEFRELCIGLLKSLEIQETGLYSPDTQYWIDLARESLGMSIQPPTDEQIEEFAEPYMELCEDGLTGVIFDEVKFGRALLERWGRRHLSPVPKEDRLPDATDRDDWGRCWLTTTNVDPGWVLDDPYQSTNWTHWLPHFSLPIPSIQ